MLGWGILRYIKDRGISTRGAGAMESREKRTFILGILTGSLAVVFLLGGAAAAWGWHEAVAARSHGLTVPILPVQQAPQLNPKEFIPFPNNGNGVGPGPQNTTPGSGLRTATRSFTSIRAGCISSSRAQCRATVGIPSSSICSPMRDRKSPGSPRPVR